MAAFVASAQFQELFGATPRTLALGRTVASGNSLIVMVRPNYDVAGADLIISDNQSNTYTIDFDTTDYNGTDQLVFVRCHNITNGPTSLTFSWTGGGDRYLTVYWMEISGLANAGPSATNRTNLPFGSAISASLSSTGANAFGLSFLDSNGRDPTPETGFTRAPASGIANVWMYDEDLGAAGSKTFGATWSGGDTQAVMWSMIYENASSGPAAPVRSYALRQQLNN